MMQFSLISLMPGLLRKLQDCADPELDHYEKTLIQPASLKTSERSSCRLYFFSSQETADSSSVVLHGSSLAAVGHTIAQ